MAKDCKNCFNCDSLHGFMATCRRSYYEEREGTLWHVQHGEDVHRTRANKCEHYTEEEYERGTFVL